MSAGRKIPRVAWIALGLCVLAVIGLHQLSRPPVATRLVLDQIGRTLGLQITATGTAGYTLRGSPTLTIRNVEAREPGASQPLLRADRIHLALPWSTVRGLTGSADTTAIAIDRIEIDRPVIDVGALQHWLANRPPGKQRPLTLTRGLRVTDATLLGRGWSLSNLALELPSLTPAAQVRATTSGRYRNGSQVLPFALHVTLSRPSLDAALGVAGRLSIEQSGWRLPSQIVLSGAMHAKDGFRLQHAKLAASGQYLAGDTRVPFAIGIAGDVRDHDGRVEIAPIAIVTHGSGSIPDASLRGALAVSNRLAVDLSGKLADWPTTWPSLPAPVAMSSSPLDIAIHYAGNPDLADVTRLRLQRDATRFDGQFRLADVTRWISASNGSPLPPINGTISTPQLDIAGAQLQGVTIDLRDGIASPTK